MPRAQFREQYAHAREAYYPKARAIAEFNPWRQVVEKRKIRSHFMDIAASGQFWRS